MLRPLIVVICLALGALAAACGEGEAPPPRQWPPTPTPVATASGSPMLPDPSPEPPTELRVAFINLLSPLQADATNTLAANTFEARLAIIIAEMKEFKPDIVGFNEASITKAHGSAVTKLAKELKMEFVYYRANPWLPGQTREQSDELVRQVGFEEGELLLVRTDRFPIKESESFILNPRSSETGERRIGIHTVLLRGPKGIEEIDVFLTHLTSGGERTIRAQAYDFAVTVAKERGSGPTVVMVGQSDPASPSTYEYYKAIALKDVAGADAVATCCRESVTGPQPALTARSDYLMGGRFPSWTYRLWGDIPSVQPDGSLLYASDHVGVAAVFTLPPRQASE